ncbi:MAG: RNA polymerase sigma factor [Chloroflexi bacterium]|nr:RNA polymerase sigma factor [Chloroflexota bacterium]
MEESEAITRLQAGDIGGLEELVRRHYIHALRTAYLIVRDHSIAEDIVQAAFLRIFERIEQFQTGRSFEPWFIRSIVNDALMLERRKRRSPDSVSESEARLLPSYAPAMDERLMRSETSEAIWATLGKLSLSQRAVIVMRYYLDMSEDEMASKLNCPPGTVKSRLHAARQRLRQLLPKWVGG